MIRQLHDDVAVVGWACRLPGAPSISELWSLLLEGRCAISRVPPDRYSLQRYGHPRRHERGKSYTWAAGVLDDIWAFDPAVFGISPREAEQMDPQQRIILELAWEAIEDAGIRPSSIAGTDVGVYVGASLSEYAHSLYGDLAAADSHFASGTSLAVIANRVSYALDLHGPSITVDTACSSSLVALNQAVEALRSGRIDTAIVGGVNVLASPAPFVLFSQAMMLSPTGLCRAFSADADGFVRAEGGVVLVLRKAALASNDGNPIRGIILASDVNSDGHTNGISFPSEAAQEQLITRVYSRSGLDPNRLAFVEAHGTGTPAGDPVEARAIGRSLGQQRTHPLPIGSIKTNIGHLEPASGLAGVVKALLALHHGVLPSTLHFNGPNPNIPFDDLNLTISNQPLLLSNANEQCAGVSSFGFGGTNAHVVVAARRRNAARNNAQGSNGSSFFTVSAATKEALAALARKYAVRLAGISDEETAIVASAAAHRRDQFSNRIAIASSNNQDIVEALAAFTSGAGHPLLMAGEAIGIGVPVAFVYSGNGSQWVGMGVTAYRRSRDFRAQFDEIDGHFKPLAGWGLAEALSSGQLPERMKRTSVAQPLIFAIQSAATAALRKLGLSPAAVLGHSVGEVAAAEAAGILDLRTAVNLIYFRSMHQESVRGHGIIAAVLASRETIGSLLESVSGIELAAINSPRASTVSGPTQSLASFVRAAATHGIAVLDLDLDYPFHSALMAPIEQALTASLQDIVPRAGNVPFVSTVTGSVLPGSYLGPNYWWRNVREPVQFLAAIRQAVALGVRYFVEIGPRSVLLKHIADSAESVVTNLGVLSILDPRDQDRDPFPAAIAKSVVAGAEIETSTVFGPDPGGDISLPSYPWQQKRFHYAPTLEAVGGVNEALRHPLAGGRHMADALEWHNHIDTLLLPELADHKLGDQIVLPGTGFLEMAIFVARQWLKSDSVIIADFETLKALDLSKGQTSELMTRISPASNTLEIFSRPRLSTAGWMLNCRGKMLLGSPHESVEIPTCGQVRASYDRGFIYNLSAANGLPYGPAFQLARDVKSYGNDLIGVELDPNGAFSPYVLDPVRLDCCMHGFFLVFPDVEAEKRGVTYIPVRVDETLVLRHGVPHRALTEVLSKNARAIVLNYYISDINGELLAVLRRVRCQAIRVRRSDTLEAVGLVELPCLLDGALIGHTGTPVRSADVVAYFRSQGVVVDDARPNDATRLMEGWAVAAAYEIATALSDDFRIAPDILIDSGRLAPELRPWFVNLLIHLEAAGLAQRDDGEWVLKKDLLLPTSASLVPLLAHDQPGRAGELLVAGALSGWVREIRIDKSVTPPSQPVLSGAVLDFFDVTSGTAHDASRLLSRLLEGLDGLWPKDRALRVLQIGSTAISAVMAAPSHGRAINVAIFEADRRRLENARPTLERTRNVSFLEAESAIRPQSYDLIISAEGLHHMPRVTLATLRKALAPRGLLLAIEPRLSLFRDLAFGLQPEWFEPGIADYPIGLLRSPAAWQAELTSAGFARAEIATIDGGSGAASLIAAESEAMASHEMDRLPAATRAQKRSVKIIEQTDVRELELTATLARVLLAGGDNAWVATPEAGACSEDEAAPDIVVHFPKMLDAPVDLVESLSARCFDMKACADRIGKKGTVLWYVFFGALHNAISKVQPIEAGAWAFSRTIANEYPQIDVRRIDVLPHLSPRVAGERIRDIIISATDETELQVDANAIRAVRVQSVRRAIEQRSGVIVASAACLELHPGPPRRLQWKPIERTPPAADQVEIEVEATGLNFRDLMSMLSLLPDDILEDGLSGSTMGLECAGRVVRVGSGVKRLAVGDRAVALAASGFATHATVSSVHAIKLPPEITSAAGATIPVAFFTSYYSLITLAQLKRGEWVLIHGGAGGVGMAAIQIAQARGAQIIATAGSKAKRNLLETFGVAHVLDSRSMGFVGEVRQITAAGVDVVLNSLAGEAMERSVACLRPFGRFIELGKRDYVNNTHLGLRPFRRNLSYFGVDIDQLVAGRTDICETIFAEIMREFHTGALSPLPHSIFAADQIHEAFHLMQQSSHIGKIVVRPPKLASIQIPPKSFEIRTDGTHLITGAFGGFGLEIAKWLADKGARRLVMIGRQGPRGPAADGVLEELSNRGVAVIAEACDVSDLHALGRLIDKIKSTMPPLAGVIHAAMVLEDATLANLDHARMSRVLAPKVRGADNLDNLTRHLKLDYFVLFSTLVTLIGNPGQGNYVAANAFMEGLARRRRQEGLPALAVGWGPIADVGVLVRKQLLESSIEKLSGVRGMTAREGLELMAQALALPADDVDLAVVTIAPSEGGFGGGHLAVLRSPTYAAMSHAGSGPQADAEARIDVRLLLDEQGKEVARRCVADSIAAQLARVLHARADDISRVRVLGEIGLDSLMALELAMSLEATFGASISLVGSGGQLTVSDLAEQVIAQVGGDRTPDTDIASLMAERHVGKVDAYHVGVVKEVLSGDSPQRKAPHLGRKRFTAP